MMGIVLSLISYYTNINMEAKYCGKRLNKELEEVPSKSLRIETTNSNDIESFHINDLPLDILILIFTKFSLPELLNIVSLVCCYWYEIVNQPSLWTVVKFKMGYKVNDCVLDRMTSINPNLTHLDLSDSYHLTTNGFIKMLQRCQRLKILKLIRTKNIDNDGFYEIGTYLHNLRELNLESTYLIEDRELIHISENNRELEKIILSHCKMLTDEAITGLTKNCNKLKIITFNTCVLIGDKSVGSIAKYCNNITSLAIMECAVTQQSLSHLIECTQLKSFEFNLVKNNVNRELKYFFNFCTNIESLSFSLTESVDDECVQHIVKQCKKLQKINLVSCNISDKALITMGQYCKHLRHVDVAWCNNITESGVSEISHTCPTLSYLCLTRCDKVDESTVLELCEQYPNIYYSTVNLEVRRLIAKAEAEGINIDMAKK